VSFVVIAVGSRYPEKRNGISRVMVGQIISIKFSQVYSCYCCSMRYITYVGPNITSRVLFGHTNCT
jgi:hypothetical protein